MTESVCFKKWALKYHKFTWNNHITDLPITHNASLNHYIDNQQIFEHTDIVSFDQYSDSKNYHSFLYWCDAYKIIKPRKPFWVMETAPLFSGSIYGHQTVHENGYIAAEAAAAYASGTRYVGAYAARYRQWSGHIVFTPAWNGRVEIYCSRMNQKRIHRPRIVG